MLSAAYLTVDKAGPLQRLEVLRYRVQGHVEGSRDVGDPEGSSAKASQDRPARRIRESREGPAEPRVKIFNHWVDYIGWAKAMSRSISPSLRILEMGSDLLLRAIRSKPKRSGKGSGIKGDGVAPEWASMLGQPQGNSST